MSCFTVGDDRGIMALERDIDKFEALGQVPLDLDWHVYSCEGTHKMWYEALSKVWRKSKPRNPNEATKLVYDTMLSIHKNGLHHDDIQDFLHFYGLPSYYSLIPASPGEVSLVKEDALASPDVEDAPAFKFCTLPVNGKRVIDGVCFSVSVPVEKCYLLPEEILLAVGERYRALANGDNRRALELLEQFNTSQDYELVECGNVEYLAKKYIIKIRGISAPKLGTGDGTKARDELKKMLDRKCLAISVYYIDEEMCYVADVHFRQNSLKEILLEKESLLWEEENNDQQSTDFEIVPKQGY